MTLEIIYSMGFGELKWLEPEDYYRDGWSIVGQVLGPDPEGKLDYVPYDVVIDANECEMRYTSI